VRGKQVQAVPISVIDVRSARTLGATRATRPARGRPATTDCFATSAMLLKLARLSQTVTNLLGPWSAADPTMPERRQEMAGCYLTASSAAARLPRFCAVTREINHLREFQLFLWT
jgi:hypothetical protein